MAVDPSTHIAYVANLGSDNVSVINEATNTVTATIPVGGGPLGWRWITAAGTVYVANKFSSTMSVINDGDQHGDRHHSRGRHPNEVAVDASLGTVYVAKAARLRMARCQ